MVEVLYPDSVLGDTCSGPRPTGCPACPGVGPGMGARNTLSPSWRPTVAVSPEGGAIPSGDATPRHGADPPQALAGGAHPPESLLTPVVSLNVGDPERRRGQPLPPGPRRFRLLGRGVLVRDLPERPQATPWGLGDPVNEADANCGSAHCHGAINDSHPASP